MKLESEKRLLQILIAVGCLIPLGAGASGMLEGIGLMDAGPNVDLDSHFRYLSGLLFGIGVGFLSTIPRIEAQGARVGLMTMMVLIGGLARLLAVFVTGVPGVAMLGALGVELVAVPLLFIWQRSLAGRYAAR